MTLLNKEPVKRAEKCLKEFDENLSVVELENSAKTALDAANSLNCEVGAIVKSLLIKIENDFLLCLVSGVGHINKIQIFIDNSLSRFTDIFAAAGHPNVIFKINYEKLIQITKGDVKDITE